MNPIENLRQVSLSTMTFVIMEYETEKASLILARETSKDGVDIKVTLRIKDSKEYNKHIFSTGSVENNCKDIQSILEKNYTKGELEDIRIELIRLNPTGNNYDSISDLLAKLEYSQLNIEKTVERRHNERIERMEEIVSDSIQYLGYREDTKMIYGYKRKNGDIVFSYVEEDNDITTEFVLGELGSIEEFVSHLEDELDKRGIYVNGFNVKCADELNRQFSKYVYNKALEDSPSDSNLYKIIYAMRIDNKETNKY